MSEWRFYAQRPQSGLWLDTNVQLGQPNLTWALSAPNSGKASVPAGLQADYIASDGRPTWGKMDTLLFAEEDGDLAWCGICTGANPSKEGLGLEFVGVSGWLQKIPYDAISSIWQTNVFDVVRALIAHSSKYKPGFDFHVTQGNSMFTVGDPQPPPKPKQPGRRKGESKSEWQGSKRYDAWQEAMEDWNKKYGDREKYELGWYEAPYVGEEIDSLAKEVGFDYRERVAWQNRGTLEPRFYIDLADTFTKRRTDIEFVDGLNIAAPLDPKNDGDIFANNVIALGAGEGKGMLRAEVGDKDGRLYQAEYVQYKTIRNRERLRNLAQADHKLFSQTKPKIDKVVAWDAPGYSSLTTLRVGDEVRVVSQNHQPPISEWVAVEQITRVTTDAVVTLSVRTVS